MHFAMFKYHYLKYNLKKQTAYIEHQEKNSYVDSITNLQSWYNLFRRIFYMYMFEKWKIKSKILIN